MTALQCEDLTVSIAGKQVCHQLTLNMAFGQCWGVLGQNGVGKTTLLHTLANLRRPHSGRVCVQDKPLPRWPRRALAQMLGILVQDVADPFPATVLETALIGRHPYTPAWRMETDEDVALAKAALQTVELDALADRDVNTLSGGERQRLALATILTQSPRIFLLDEPTNHLDLHYQVSLLSMIVRKTQDEKALAVMTLHDVNLAARFCDHLILLLDDGEVAFGPTEDMLTDNYLNRLYRHPITRIESTAGRAFLPK